MDQISFEDGIPLSMNPIPNNLKPTFFNLAPLASVKSENGIKYFTNFVLQREKVIVAEPEPHVVGVQLCNGDHGLVLEEVKVRQVVHTSTTRD